jgi:hypothetical protein
MARHSQNGYTACDSSVIAKYTIPGTSVKVNIRKGDVSVVLLDFAAWFDDHVEKLIQDQCGGYNCREIAGSSTLSNHASGTSIDLNWNKHPQGRRHAGFTASQRSAIHSRLATYGGVIRWGDDYSGTPDAMHFEINKSAGAVKTAADRIRGAAGGGSKPSTGGGLPRYAAGSRENSRSKNNAGTDVATLQRFIGSEHAGAADGHFGSHTERGVRWYQDMRGLHVDGIAGPRTWAPILAALR